MVAVAVLRQNDSTLTSERSRLPEAMYTPRKARESMGLMEPFPLEGLPAMMILMGGPMYLCQEEHRTDEGPKTVKCDRTHDLRATRGNSGKKKLSAVRTSTGYKSSTLFYSRCIWFSSEYTKVQIFKTQNIPPTSMSRRFCFYFCTSLGFYVTMYHLSSQ